MANQLGSPDAPKRVVLEAVPKVGFYDGTRCPEDVPFPSCLRAYLEYVGDGCGCKYARAPDPDWQCGCTYAFLIGVSGAAFRLSWRPGWHGDNVDITHMSDNPAAPFDRALEATGYAYEYLRKEEGREARRSFDAALSRAFATRAGLCWPSASSGHPSVASSPATTSAATS